MYPNKIKETQLKYADLVLSSSDFSNEKVDLTLLHWLSKIEPEKAHHGWYDTTNTPQSIEAIKYKYYSGNTEWEFFAYKIEKDVLYDYVGEKNYSTINIKFGFKRNSTYYTMTLLVPILALTFLSPIGLILPGQYKIAVNN